MQRIVITGKNSYIGNHIQEWIQRKDESYKILQVDVQNSDWKKFRFMPNDIVIHTAGIVHRPDVKDWSLYEKVNVELPVEVAEKAKKANAVHFVFLSSMAIYGVKKQLKKNVITQDTSINPVSLYGRSKYLAESRIRKLESENFLITIVRPPNVYGYNCKGGYISGFTSIVKKMPAIPYAFDEVKQSVIYIDNLTECIYQIIKNKKSGIFMPQDDKSVSAVELMEQIAAGINRPLKRSIILGIIPKILNKLSIVNKAYGGIEYSSELSVMDFPYVVVKFNEAIKYVVRRK